MLLLLRFVLRWSSDYAFFFVFFFILYLLLEYSKYVQLFACRQQENSFFLVVSTLTFNLLHRAWARLVMFYLLFPC